MYLFAAGAFTVMGLLILTGRMSGPEERPLLYVISMVPGAGGYYILWAGAMHNGFIGWVVLVTSIVVGGLTFLSWATSSTEDTNRKPQTPRQRPKAPQ